MTAPPPEPMLLDTCVLQHLAWVEQVIDDAGGHVTWTDQTEAALATRYGAPMTRELLDLGALFVELQQRDGFPWVVSNSSQRELTAFAGHRAIGARSLFEYFDGHQDDWHASSYPGVALGTLRAGSCSRPSQLILRGLGVETVDAIVAADGPLAFLPDAGDRQIARDALVANVPAILTLDLRTFWRHQELLRELGVAVWRPSELLRAYTRVWQAGE